MDRRRVVNLLDATLAANVRIDNVAAWCREHAVPVRTFYRHRARWLTDRDLSPRSRRPHTSPGETPPDLVAWICKLRVELTPDNGADFIHDELAVVAARTRPAWTVPARSTINRVLSRADLLDRNPKKRPRSSWRRFAYARPRDCYQIDATDLGPDLTLADGTRVVVFDVLDDCTRLLVACHAAPAETADAAITAVTKAVHNHGTPALVLSDNGAAFTNRNIPAAGPSRFTQAVTATGARLIHSSPYHPQTCGKVERHHQTLKRWLVTHYATHPPSRTLQALQRLLNTYRAHYNTERRHSALGRRTPQHAWTTATSHGGPTSPPRQTDATLHRLHVSATGVVRVGAYRLGIGTRYRGHAVTAIRDDRRITIYTTDGQPITTTTIPDQPGYIRQSQRSITVPHVPGQTLDTCPGT
jgi:transposase InsO family protein